jgi:transcriptional enhancer factor
MLAVHTLFPKNKTPKNGFEDSFKNDPCLRALSEGRLPDQSPEQYAMFNQVLGMPMVSRTSTEPNVFWLLITSSSIPTDANGRNTNEEDLYHSGLVAHKYTSLSTQRPSDSIESIFNWRHRFPQLYHHHSTSSFSCEVIHMDVALCLMVSHPPEGAELVSRTEISLPNAGYDHESGMYLEDSTWRIATTLSKPAELCHNPAVDPPILNQMSIIPILSMNVQEARIKVPFPAMAWAHAFTSLTDLSQKPLTLNTVNTSHLLDEISMYQEVQWSPGPGVPFQRRAMILWTFRQSKDGEESCTTWRYLEMGNRGRHECMSPDLDHNQRLNASMHETFNTSFIGDTLETTAMDPFIQSHSLVNQTGLATPPATAGLQSPFGEHQQPVYALSGLGITNHFNIGGNSLSFESVTSVDNEATLVESNVAGNLDSFIGNNNASLASFDGGNQEWVLDGRGSSNAVDSFVSGNTNWTYSELQSASNSVTLHLGGWEDVATINTKGNNNWVLEEGLKGHEWTGRGMEERVKELEWVVELPAQANEDNEWESTRSQIDTVESVGQGANQEGLDEDGYEVVGNWIEERHDRHEDIDALSGLKDEEHAAYTFSSKKDEIKKELWEGIGEAGDEADPCEYLQLGDRSK